MAEPRPLANAPITEAIIDFTANFTQPIEIGVLASAYERVKDTYPNIQIQQQFKGEIKFVGDQLPVSTVEPSEVKGFAFLNPDETQVVQFRVDGFTFSRMKPYTTWEEIFPEALRLWLIYEEVCSPDGLSRIATRFINQIALPTPFESFGVFLTAPPAIPPKISPLISAFLTQVTIRPEIETNTFVNVTQSLSPESDEKHAVVILDIDAYRFFEASEPNDEKSITHAFGKLRDLKNLIFFDSLTETALELFQ